MQVLPKTGWLAQPIGNTIHVLPLGDPIGHVPTVTCPCGPRVQFVFSRCYVVTHASLDGRELEGR